MQSFSYRSNSEKSSTTIVEKNDPALISSLTCSISNFRLPPVTET